MCIIVTGVSTLYHETSEHWLIFHKGAGFIGSHLVEFLLGRGDEVISIDSLWTGSKRNVTKFEGNKKFRFIK